MQPRTATAGFLVIARRSPAARRRKGVEAAVDVLRGRGPTDFRWTDDLEQVGHIVGEAGDRRLVVVGGDGALHAVLNLLDSQHLPTTEIAVVPAGTGNDLARAVDLPLDQCAAARLAADGVARPLDLLEVEGAGAEHRWAHNAVHSGIGVEAARTGTRWKRRLGAAAYGVGAVITGLRFHGPRATVTVDGAVIHDGPALLVAALVGESVGGGFALDPDGTPDERRLTVLVLPDVPLRRRPGLAWALARQRHERRSDIVRSTGRHVEVVGHDAVDTDGELVEVPGRWSATVRPAAWRLVLA